MVNLSSYDLQCVVVTPERAVVDARADFISLPMYDGELGVLPGRAPLIGRLGYGELRYRKGTQTTHLYVDGGFVQVRDNKVTILTARAFRSMDLETESIQANLNSTLQKMKDTAGREAQDNLLVLQQKARAQMRVARKRAEAIGDLTRDLEKSRGEI